MARARVPGLVQGGRGGPDQVVEKLLVIVAVDPQATLRYSLHCCSFPLWRAPRNWALSACLSCLSNYGPMEPCEWPNVQYCRSIIDRVSCPYVPFCLLCLGPKAHGTICYRGTWLQLAIGSAEQHLLSPSGAIFSPPPVNRLDSIPFLASLTLCPFSLFTTRTLALVTVRGVDHSPTFETPSRPVHPEWDAFLICSQLLGLPLPFVYCLHCSLVAVTQGGPDTIPIISYPLVHFFSFRPASYATGPQPWETLSLLKVSLFHTPP